MPDKEEPLVIQFVIQLNDDSKMESHIGAMVAQSLGQHDVNVANKIRASNHGPPVKEPQTAVHKQHSTDNSEPSPLRNIIPHLLRQSNVLKFEAPDSPLSCRPCKETPQQTNGLETDYAFDGVLSLKPTREAEKGEGLNLIFRLENATIGYAGEGLCIPNFHFPIICVYDQINQFK
ncbi:Uncharacterized protein Fot_37821 [Forsythia ovata]|uniref:Uncharacterized protein n=1 Tax=Forsythia ovata TaxID=205694 RepID=A0ABD1S451_9LAMI